MGFRTVIVLQNDQTEAWRNDPKLGDKIFYAAASHSFRGDDDRARRELPYGSIVEQVHADTQTLAVLDGYSGKPVAYTHWHRGQTNEVLELALLKELARKHNMVLHKKPAKKV